MRSATSCSFAGCVREATGPADDLIPTCDFHGSLIGNPVAAPAPPLTSGAVEIVALLRECITGPGPSLRLWKLSQQAVAIRISWAIDLIERLTAVDPAVAAVLVDLAATEESFCPYYRKVGDKQCDRGCTDEPNCQTCHPPEGWPLERLPAPWRAAVEAEYDRREIEGWS